MSRNTVATYAVAAGILTAWVVMSGDYVPALLLLGVVVAALVHFIGPGRRARGADDHHLREQAKVRYGVNAPDRPRF